MTPKKRRKNSGGKLHLKRGRSGKGGLQKRSGSGRSKTGGIDRSVAPFPEPSEATPMEISDRIDMNYRYSYGGISRFFQELRDHRRILGSRCETCKKVYLPPRVNCSVCYRPTRWVPLGNEGTIITCTIVYYATSRFFSKTPFVCAYIKLDGADTLLLQNVIMDDVAAARPGMRVRALFQQERKGEISDFYFVPL